jgi:hypothetical protein
MIIYFPGVLRRRKKPCLSATCEIPTPGYPHGYPQRAHDARERNLQRRSADDFREDFREFVVAENSSGR